MKKWKQLVVVGLIAVSMTSCKSGGQQNQSSEAASEAVTADLGQTGEDASSSSEEETGAVELPNPFEEVDEPEALKKIGVSMEVPEEAENVTCGIISGEVAEISFQLEETPYTYRGAVKAEDFAGIFEEFEPDAVALSDCGADEDLIVRTTVSGGRLANWTRRGAKYTLYTPKAVEDADLFALCIKLIGKN
ncbi:MAG: hypothetical protein Q4C66_15760 [Lachnospiraceae bacterium]|nr:hypothetical protein [Lachnospiraceae bacterium]